MKIRAPIIRIHCESFGHYVYSIALIARSKNA